MALEDAFNPMRGDRMAVDRWYLERAAKTLKYALEAKLPVPTDRGGLRYLAWCNADGCIYVASSDGCKYYLLATGRPERAVDEIEWLYKEVLPTLRVDAQTGGLKEVKRFKEETMKLLEQMRKDYEYLSFLLEYGGSTVKLELC